MTGRGDGSELDPQTETYAGLGDWTPEALGAGRVLPVVSAPDAVLSSAGAEVDPTADETVQLAADLIATMRVSPGCVGLAAPQVGVGAQVFAVNVTGHRQGGDGARHVRALQRPGGRGDPVEDGPGGMHVGARPHR